MTLDDDLVVVVTWIFLDDVIVLDKLLLDTDGVIFEIFLLDVDDVVFLFTFYVLDGNHAEGGEGFLELFLIFGQLEFEACELIETIEAGTADGGGKGFGDELK